MQTNHNQKIALEIKDLIRILALEVFAKNEQAAHDCVERYIRTPPEQIAALDTSIENALRRQKSTSSIQDLKQTSAATCDLFYVGLYTKLLQHKVELFSPKEELCIKKTTLFDKLSAAINVEIERLETLAKSRWYTAKMQGKAQRKANAIKDSLWRARIYYEGDVDDNQFTEAFLSFSHQGQPSLRETLKTHRFSSCCGLKTARALKNVTDYVKQLCRERAQQEQNPDRLFYKRGQAPQQISGLELALLTDEEHVRTNTPASPCK